MMCDTCIYTIVVGSFYLYLGRIFDCALSECILVGKIDERLKKKEKPEKMLKILIFRSHFEDRVTQSSKSSIFASTANHLTNFLI